MLVHIEFSASKAGCIFSLQVHETSSKQKKEHRFSLFRSFWLIWAMLFGAAVNTDNPRGMSSRFMANIWALFAVVFTASYTANLAAFMITKEDYDKLTGIQDWRLMNPTARKPPFKFATVPHGSTETNLKKNFREMYNYMQPYNKTSVQEGVTAVKDQDINAFLYDATVLEYLAGRDDRCKLRTVGNWYAMTGYGVAFPHGSKWIDVFNKYLVEFQNNGDMERLQKFWLSGACTKQNVEGESSMQLGILNFTSAFILLAGGMLLGALLLLLEHVYFKFFRHKLRKWDKCGCCGLVSLSMGKSLTFEQSVREALDLQRNFKCKNPVCETNIWKVKHELDLALLKVDRLQKQLTDNGISYRGQKAIWRDTRTVPGGAQPAIGWNPDVYGSHHPAYDHTPSVMATPALMPSATSDTTTPGYNNMYPLPPVNIPPDDPCDMDPPQYPADVSQPDSLYHQIHPPILPAESYQTKSGSQPPPALDQQGGYTPGNQDHQWFPLHTSGTEDLSVDDRGANPYNRSRSVPTSPVKKYAQGGNSSPVWKSSADQHPPPPDISAANEAEAPLLASKPLGSVPDVQAADYSSPSRDMLGGSSKKMRKHRGNKYMQVMAGGNQEGKDGAGSGTQSDDDTLENTGNDVEKETVL